MSQAADSTRPIALVTARAAHALDGDLPPLLAAFAAQGTAAEAVDWDDERVDWSRFRLALLRSTWDYSARLAEFLGWLDRTAQLTRVLNPPPVVRWSLDKHYLAELKAAGAAIVPTLFVEPGDDAAAALQQFLLREAAADIVIKPVVASGSRDAQRHHRGEVDAMTAHVARLLAEGRSVLVQPYLERVDDHGETALMYINGEFSHAIRKGPLLRRGSGPTEALFAPEEITPRTPSADELALGARVLRALPFAPLLYARIDLLRGADGAPCVLELELAEPSLFFAYDARAAARFARLAAATAAGA
jgi:O-ureido-D-serine cyclo-ligase